MNASEAFEHRKEALLEQLHAAKTLDQAIAACVMALEQTACELAQDEQDEHARQRQQAVMALVRSMPHLLRSAKAQGELVLVPAQQAEAPKTKFSLGRIVQIIGAFMLGSLAVHELLDGQRLFALLQLLGGGLLFAGGLRMQPRLAQHEYCARGVLAVDADETVRWLAQLCHAADVCAGDLAIIGQEDGMVRLSGTADEAMLDLLVVLMEAKASGRSELAMRSLAQAEQYLRMLGIEAVFYGSGHDEMFDLLPTLGETRTIRPALIQDGKVLRRGTAACSMERGMTR